MASAPALITLRTTTRLRSCPHGDARLPRCPRDTVGRSFGQIQMSLTATARSIPGTLRQEVVIDGKHRLITDQPEQLGGEGSGPSPHELLPAALAACVTVTLVQYGRTKGWELGEVTVDVDYDKHSTPRRVETVIRFAGELGDDQIERLEKVA